MIVAIKMDNDDWWEQRQLTPYEFKYLLDRTPQDIAVHYLGWRTICFEIHYKIISYKDIPFTKYLNENRRS